MTLRPLAALLFLAPALLAQRGPSAPERAEGARPSGALLQASAQGTTLQSYDLGRVVPVLDQEPWTRRLFVDPTGELGGPTASGPAARRSPPETVVELLTQLLGDELRQQGRSIALEGEDRLLVVAPPAVQARIEKLLDDMRAVLQAELALRVELYTLRGESVAPPAMGTLGAEAAARLRGELVARGARVESHRVRLQAGRSSEVRAEESVAFLGDWDVEIAQSSYIHDPKVMEARTGSRLVLRGVSVPGGTLVSSFVRMASLDGLSESELDLKGLLGTEGKGISVFAGPVSALQQASVGVGAVAFQSFLPEGGTLAFALATETGGAGRVQRVVLLHHEQGSLAGLATLPFEGTERSVILLNGERIRPPALSFELGEGGAYAEQAHPLLAVRSESPFPLFLLDWVRARFSVWRVLGPWIAVVSDPAWDLGPGELEALLADYALATEVADVVLEVRAGAERALCTVHLPVLVGSAAGVLAGGTRTSLVEREVEVAQFAAAPAPVVEALFEGLAATLLVWPAERGGASIALRGSTRAFAGEPERRALGGPLGGEVELVRRSLASFDERLRLSEEGGRPLRARLGEGSALSLEVRVR